MSTRITRTPRVRPPILAGVATLSVIAATALLAVAFGPVSSAAAPGAIDMADMFLVEQDGDWFCEDMRATCPMGHKPAQAAADLLTELRGAKHGNLYLRVAKARNNCKLKVTEPSACKTGVPVPPRKGCAASPAAPWCALDELRDLGVKLGVVVGAEDDSDNPRGVAELAWHACRISKADTTRLYDFLFLDLTRNLKTRDLRRAIRRIRAGRTGAGKPCPGVPRKQRGLRKVITNDNHTWRRGEPASLRTGAWAHAKRLAVLGEGAGAIDGDITPALRDEDLAFVKEVNDLKGPTRAVLRLEVPTQTSRFAGLPRNDQCSLLTRWARRQREHRYTLIYPLYVHGAAGANPYDSFGQRTFGLQAALIDRYPSRRGTRGLPDCASQGGDDEGPSGGGRPVPPAPILRLAGVGSQEPSTIKCTSARLHGWVNPHGRATTFHFEYWQRGVNVPRATGTGDAGAGVNRVDVSRVAAGLRKDTGYAAKLIATNAAGRSVSDVVSFKTRPSC